MFKKKIGVMAFFGFSCLTLGCKSSQAVHNADKVALTPGLIAFWDFDKAIQGEWGSVSDPKLNMPSFAIKLRRIGDKKAYSHTQWPYKDAKSALLFDSQGPFGKAVRFNKGYVYGAIQRKDFDDTPLNLNGKKPFTLMVWTKFVGVRHMVAGIWDEGGWDKYSGRRQVALFAGLFNQKGTIAHVSATGAASFPQSSISGSQYARLRAIDGQPFNNNQWVAMAMTYDPDSNEVKAYLNGQMTALMLNDPVTQDVFRFDRVQPANPFKFNLPIYSPQAFVIKYNGYGSESWGIGEHRLLVDLRAGNVTYQSSVNGLDDEKNHRVSFDILRNKKRLFKEQIRLTEQNGNRASLPTKAIFKTGDEIVTTLERREQGAWVQVGTTIITRLKLGAPFTFGRALGLGSDDLEHGSQLYLDGVAVFNRVLSDDELKRLSFVN